MILLYVYEHTNLYLMKMCQIFFAGDKFMREVILHPGEDGYWVVECPSLPGCISQGKTKEEAITNIKEAIQGYINSLKEDGISVPEEKFETIIVAV